MTKSVRIGISTCPNDTFCFHALLEGVVQPEGIELEFTLADVEELNEGMLKGSFDVGKMSFHAALLQAQKFYVLPAGSALGYGVGPLLLGRAENKRWDPKQAHRTLAPGRYTTATLLMRLFYPEQEELEQTVFSEILPALQTNAADYGVCIHEGRFVWESLGLACIEDLGERFEKETNSALPLGGICVQRALEPTLAQTLARAISDSLEWGLAHPAACLPTMRRYAQEQKDEVLQSHVDLYVNEWTRDLGEEGRRSLDALSRLAQERGLIPAGVALEVLPHAAPLK